jgi:radical SAM superfamily enzyme YgiQ (UPF0313 family)
MNLAYGAACLKEASFDPFLKDYPAERKTLVDLAEDLKNIKPVICIVNVNPSSELDDLAAIDLIRQRLSDCKIIACAPYLALYELEELSSKVLDSCDAILIAEHPESLVPLAKSLILGRFGDLKIIEGILFKDPATNSKVKTPYPVPGYLDELPLPARDLMNNSLYIRPDSGKPQALIQTGRGCPSSCTFCLTPSLTGKAFCQRSVESLMKEVKNCVNNYGIDQIFFRADTFTINKTWVKNLCQAIISSGLKISWCANSRANIIDDEILAAMKKSGCWLLAFGFESGSSETLKRTQKGITVEQNEAARKKCRKHGIKVQGQYIIGFPWEGKQHIKETFDHIKRMQCDFIDVQILVPYKGTAIYKEMKSKYATLLKNSIGSKIQGGVLGTAFGLTKEDLMRYQRQMLRSAYLSPSSILKRMMSFKSPSEFINYSKYGLNFILNQFFRVQKEE